MLPEGWKSVPLAEICSSPISYGIVQTGEHVPDGIPCLRVIDIAKKEIDLDECIRTNEIINSQYKRTLLNEGDIVLALRGEIGLAKMIEKRHSGVNITRGLAKISSNRKKLIPHFLLQALRAPSLKAELDRRSGGSALQEISLGELRKASILLPPLPEQKKIAAILSTWDRAIEGTEKLLANSQQQKKALMQQLLAPDKKRLPGFTGEWKTRTLGEIGEISSAGVDKKIVDGEEPIRLLNFTDVFKRTFIYSDDLHQWVTAPSIKVQKCNVKKGDVFFTPSSETRNDIAFSAVATENMQGCCYSYHVVRLRFKEKWDDAFKAFIFSTMSFRRQVYKLADGSGQRYVISQDDFRSIEITYPSLDEQCQIGTILRTAENEITALESDLSRLRQEKKALMQQLLTGKASREGRLKNVSPQDI